MTPPPPEAPPGPPSSGRPSSGRPWSRRPPAAPESSRRPAPPLPPPVVDPGPTPSGPLHPRLRARRIAVRRAEGRRRLVALVAVGAVVVLAAVAWGVFQSPLLAVATLDVRGTHFTDAAAVRQAAAVQGDALVTADLGAVARRVEQLPWVASARVTRRWPHTIRLEVVERSPAAALYQSDGTWSLVDGQGHVLAASAGQPAGLVPVVAGGPAVAVGGTVGGWAAQAVEVAGRLAPGLQARVRSVTLDPVGGVVVALGDGAVWLGDASDLTTKQLDALTVIGSLGPEPVGIVDVRVPGAPNRRPPPASAGPAPDAADGRANTAAPLTGADA